MKLKEIINNIDFENQKIKDAPDWENLANEFEIYDFYWSDDKRLVSYWLEVWQCTDTWVGMQATFLDGEFVYLTKQFGRKMTKDFYFYSKDSAEKVRNYILELKDEKEDSLNVGIVDLNEEHFDLYPIEYSSQILQKEAIYKPTKEKVKIVKQYFDYKHFHEVEVEFPNKEVKEIDCRELGFEYNKL